MTEQDLLPLPASALHGLLRSGHAIEPESLENAHYRGVSLGLPAVVEQLTWKTFRKAFHRDPATGVLRGWNVRLQQRGVDGRSLPLRRKDGTLAAFGHFAVVEARGRGVPGGVEQGLLLDYGQGRNRRLDPTRVVRDPLVSLVEDSAELLLGWTYLELGLLRVRTPSFFVLRREGTLDEVVPTPV